MSLAISPYIRLDHRRRKRRRFLPKLPHWQDERGVGMTLCIAAVSRADNHIVTVSDTMLSSDETSMDRVIYKATSLVRDGRWICLFAGSPSDADDIICAVQAALRSGKGKNRARIAAAFERAFRNHLRQQIEGRLLSRFGWSLKAFLSQGKDSLGIAEFGRFLGQINEVELETDFLIAGFDETLKSRLYVVSHPGICEQHTAEGFYAIGTGSTIANSYLSNSYSIKLGHRELIYRLCEAKFFAEAACGVGKETFVLVVQPDGKQKAITPNAVAPLRSIWEKTARPPVPKEAMGAVSAVLRDWEWGWPGVKP